MGFAVGEAGGAPWVYVVCVMLCPPPGSWQLGHACDLSTSVIHPDFYREPLASTAQASSSQAT